MFAVNHILDVAGHDVVGFESLVDTVNEILILWIVEVSDTEHLLGFGGSFFGEGASLVLDVDFVVLAFAEVLNETVSDLILGSGRFLTAGNDKWGTGFVNENGVGFIDDGEVESTENTAFEVWGHVVTEVVESKFGVGCVGDVASISFTLSSGIFGGEVNTDGET